MSTSSSDKSAKLKVYYGVVSVGRDPVQELEVTTKRYVDAKIVVGGCEIFSEKYGSRWLVILRW